MKALTLALAALGVALAFASVPSARANVYATSIKINGNSTEAVNVSPGSPVTISYILNEPATAGVTVNIWSDENLIRAISIPSGSGTERGLNHVVWDGQNSGGSIVGAGTYSVSVTAAATGHTNWTQISDDSDLNFYSFAPRGIAVNRNPNSPYYGRVFISNASPGPGAETNRLGDVQGILMRNADGSHTDDGAFGLAGYDWVDDGFSDSPIQIKVKEDDRLYFNDWTGRGKIVACDMRLTTNVVVLDAPNYSQNPFSAANWINFEVVDAGTSNARVLLTDASFPSAGVWMWGTVENEVGERIADPNDQTGTQVIATGGDLSLRCDGIAIDANTNLYVIQNRANPGDNSMRAAKFPNWDGQSVVTSGASWIVGGGDDTFRNLYGMALDSVTDPKILACPMFAGGTAGAHGAMSGGIRLLNAADGTPIYSEPYPFHSTLPFLDPIADESQEGGTSYAVGEGLAGQTNRFGEGWALVGSNNSAGTQPLIVEGNLSYPNLPASTGNSVAVAPSVGMTARLGFSTAATTMMYYSLILKVTDITVVPMTPANNFIAAFSDTAGAQAGTLARSTAKLVTIKSSSGEGYHVGIGKGSATGDYQYDPTERAVNDVLFIVAQYERVGGVTNVNLWVNPDPATFGTATPPLPTAAINVGSAANDVNANGPRAMAISCQNSTAPSATIDDIRVGRSWSSVTGGPEIGGPPPYISNLTATVFYRSVNWDNVGNLYAGSQSLARWRVFSPPGTNAATTVALATIQVGAAIHIANIAVAGTTATIRFTGAESDLAEAFKVQQSVAVQGEYSDVGAASVSQMSPGVFEATVPVSAGSTAFFRIRKE